MNDAHVRWQACLSRGNSWMGGAHFSGFASSPRRSDSGSGVSRTGALTDNCCRGGSWEYDRQTAYFRRDAVATATLTSRGCGVRLVRRCS